MTKEYCYNSLIEDEDEAIDGYVKAKKVFAEDAEACRVFDAIIAEEKEHIKMIKKLQAKKENLEETIDIDNYSLSEAFEHMLSEEYVDQDKYAVDFKPVVYTGKYSEGFDSIDDLIQAVAIENNSTPNEVADKFAFYANIDSTDLSRRANLVAYLYDPYLKANDDEIASYLVASRLFSKDELKTLMDDSCQFLNKEEKLAYINSVK